MKYAVLLPLLGIAIGIAGINDAIWQYFTTWTGISFILVGVSYLIPRLNIFGKRPNGTLPWYRKLILLPYLAFNHLVWHLYRIISREPASHRIEEDSIVIGRRLLVHEFSIVEKENQNFDFIIDLTSEFEEPKTIRNHPGYLSLPILDASIPGTSEQLEQLHQKTQGKSLYIHCAQGHGRTGLLTAYLLVKRGICHTTSDALELLQKTRPKLNINSQQKRFLERLKSQGEATVLSPNT